MLELALPELELAAPRLAALSLKRKRLPFSTRSVLIAPPSEHAKVAQAGLARSFPEEMLPTYEALASLRGFRFEVEDLEGADTEDLSFVTPFELKQMPVGMHHRLANGKLTCQRIGRGEYLLYERDSNRARIGLISEIVRDLEHVRQFGSLPPRRNQIANPY